MEGEMYRPSHRVSSDVLIAVSGTVILAALLFRMASYAPVSSPGAEAAAVDAAVSVATVEILALDHPSLAPALADIDKMLAGYGDRVRVVRYDPATRIGASFARRKGLRGDEPLTIFVNGTQTFTLDGRAVTFESLPDARRGGTWTLAQLDAVLRQVVGN